MTFLLVALGGAYLLLAAPLLGLYAERAALIEDRRALAPRLRAVAAELPALRAQLATLRTAASTSRVVLDGGSDAIASANLQSRIQDLAASVGATISTTESLAAEPRGAYRRIGVRVGLSTEFATMAKLLAAVETATPPLVIDNLHIFAGAAQMAPTGPARIDASFEVYGFRSSDISPAPNR